jgi:mono/diheme cytochrome c family protein
VLALCGVWTLMTPLASAQQSAAPTTRAGEPELDQWIRTTSGGSSAASDPNSETRFLASLTDDERHGGFLFRQRCYACHYSALSPQSFGPRLSQANVVGREQAARATITDGTSRMPAFRHGLTAEQIDLILAYLKKVK